MDTPRMTFLHLLAFLMLLVSAVSFIVLNFQYIEVTFPDRLDLVYGAAFEQVRFAGSVLAIAFPVFLGVSWFLETEFRAHPEKRQSRVRRWLVALTLFAAALTIIVDLITLLYHFWGGELTIRFFSKTALVLAVAGVVFGYFGWELRRDPLRKTMIPKLLAAIIGGVIFISIAAGFFVVGTPQQQRLRRFDEQRVQDLQNLQYQVINYWQTKSALPLTLENTAALYSSPLPKDPETSQPYEYRALGNLSFELCATFDLSNKEFADRVKQNAPRVYDYGWVHEAGRVCFSKVIDPDLYPQGKPPAPPYIPPRPL